MAEDRSTLLFPPSGPQRRFTIAMGLAAGLLLLWGTRYGLGASTDSVHYATAARSLLAGDGYLDIWRRHFAHWPPLFPTVLALLEVLGRNLLEAARWFQAGVFGLTVALGTAILHQDLRHRWVARAGAVLLLLSPALYLVATMLWSEALYILLSLTVVYLYPRATARGRITDLVWIVIPAGLAALQRYAGVALLGTVSVFLLLDSGPASLRRRVERAVAFGATASLPLAVWLLRNLLTTGTLTGPRGESVRDVSAGISSAVQEIGGWWLPDVLRTWGAAALLTGLLLGLVLAHRGAVRPAGHLPRLAARVRLGGWVALVHVGFMVSVAAATSLTPVGVRFLAPAVPGLVLLLAGLVDHGLGAIPSRGRPAVASLALLAYAVLVGNSVELVAERLERAHRHQALTPLVGPQWEDSLMVHWVRSQRSRRVDVYTNNLLGLLLHATPEARLRSLEDVERQISEGVAGHYVLFYDGRGGWQRDAVEALVSRHPDRLVFRGPEGAILER